MSEFDLIEQRLRRTFLAVAEQPIVTVESGARTPEIRAIASRFPRHLRIMSVSFGAVVVVAVVALVLVFGPLSKNAPGPASTGIGAKSKLQAALNATFNASGYVSTTSADPNEHIVVNAPDLTETIDNGLVSEIDVGNTEYTASWFFAAQNGYHFGPNHCGPHAMFIERSPEGGGSFSINLSLEGTRVSQDKDVFTVSRGGIVTESFVVKDGYVIQMTRIFAPPGKTVVTSYSQIGHAPKIIVPKPSEVVVSPKVFLRGCPVP